MSYRSPAQRKAIAAAIARKKASSPKASKAPYVAGKGAYYKRSPVKGPYVKGRGKYASDYGKRLGSVVGEGLQELLGRINPLAMMGFGDYVTAPWASALKSNTVYMGADPPAVVNSPMGNVIIRHREYLGDITTGDAGVFTNRAYSINPGVPETFPWLSQIAVCFEQYKLRGVVFEFKSTSADALNSTNTALGTVIMATEYDATRPSFANKQQMENHQYAMSARQSSSMLHPIECARSESTLEALYVRSGADIGEDLRFTDFGNFQIATAGQQASSVNIGELWVSYEIELLKPRFATSEGSGSVYSSHIRGSSSILNTNFFGNTQTVSGNLGITVSGNSILFPNWLREGHFIVAIAWVGTSASVGLPSFTFADCELVQSWIGNTSTSVSNTSTTSTRLITVFELNLSGPNGEIALTSGTGTLPVASSTVDVVITSYNPLASMPEQVTRYLGTYLKQPVPIATFPELCDTPAKEKEEKEEKALTPDPDPSLSKSTVESLQEIIERAKLRRSLAAASTSSK